MTRTTSGAEHPGQLLRSVVALLLAAGFVRAGLAQPATVDVAVTYVAGPNLYFDQGLDAGITVGDTLAVYRGEASLGTVRVLSSTGRRSVVTFAGAAFAATRGDVLRLAGVRVPAVETPAPAEEVTAGEPPDERPSLLETAPTARPPAPARRTRVNGRLSLELRTLFSRTAWQTNGPEHRDRTFLTPTAGLHVTVTQLPADLRLNANLRFAYRYSTRDVVQPARSLRVYDLSLEKSFRRLPVQVEAGRFYNPFEQFSGYWDGLRVHVGGPRGGFGVVSGFQPDSWNEGFTADLPKYTFFADYSVRLGTLRYDADVSFHEVMPRQDYLDHTFLGLNHRLRGRRRQFSQRLQLDRDPETGGWVVSRLLLRGAVPLTARLQLDARYSLRQPYSLWRTTNVVSPRREQAGTGLYLRLPGATAGADVTLNRPAGGDVYATYATSFNVPRTGVLGLGLHASASVWTYGARRAVHLAPGLSRAFGAVQARAGYRFYRTDDAVRPLTSHAADLSLHVPVAPRTRLALQGRTTFGAHLTSYSLYTSLWIAF